MECSESTTRRIFLLGILCGIVITVLVWIGAADQVEIAKVNAGYLTLNNKTYKVTLYDTLDVPEGNEK